MSEQPKKWCQWVHVLMVLVNHFVLPLFLLNSCSAIVHLAMFGLREMDPQLPSSLEE